MRAVDLDDLPLRRTEVADLNRLRLRLSCNDPTSPVFGYFSRYAAPAASAGHELVCVDLDVDPMDERALAELADDSTRARRFATGYYRGPYFGPPAHLVTRGSTTYLFGRRLDRIVWPYAVKQLLTVFAADTGHLHLKAGGMVGPGGTATLLVGRTGGGKTVFLEEACRAGFTFLTNTHALVKDGTAYGVPSSVRVRQPVDGAVPHLSPGEWLADPEKLFGAAVDAAPVGAVVVTNYRPGRPRFEAVDGGTALAFCEQFAEAVSAYGLKDDLLHHAGYDLDAYAAAYRAGTDQLAALCATARCFVASVDMRDPSARADVLATLG